MRTSRLLVVAAMVLVGAVWVGQGLGYVPGSFMSGDLTWALVGAALLVVAVALVLLERRPRP
jgi:hypothetical protein